MAEFADAYRGVRARVVEIVSTVDPAALDVIVPATPEWRGRDLLAHMVGVTADVVEGRLEGVATDAWTNAQVEARRAATVDDMLAEWERHSPTFETTLDGVPFALSGQALFDAVTHEHDLRHALGAPGGRDSEAVVLAWRWIIGARTAEKAPAVRFVTEDSSDVSGVGEPVATVDAPRFELMRAVTGRRTVAEMRTYGWKPEPKIDLIVAAPMFSIRDEPLGE